MIHGVSNVLEKLVSSQPVANLPWEKRPDDCRDPIWRYTRNPIISRHSVPCANSIFNSAIIPFNGEFAGVFRVDDRSRRMLLHAGRSEDGLAWRIEPKPIEFIRDDAAIGDFEYGYDPRLVWIDDRYWLTWCNGMHGPTIAIGYTFDFKEFHILENAFVPFNRNGVLFPRRINGSYCMLNRPSDSGHTPFGDIFLSFSEDMIHWGRHRYVMSGNAMWNATKIGAGPIPIETPEGWLMIYHGVLTSCNGFVYSMSAALLDLDEPWRVIHQPKSYLMCPEETYECVGDVPNVIFPCAALVDGDSGRIAIYYGAADTVTALAFTKIDNLMEWIKSNG